MAGSAFAIVEATRDRSAVGRGILMTAAVAVITGGLLVSQLGHVPALAVDPQGQGGRHRLVIHMVNGQCLVEGSANGAPFTFILDSGAAGLFFTVASHARALGIDPARLRFDHTYENWIGKVSGATVRLRELRIGEWSRSNVEAAIDQSGFRKPLLGLPFLKLLNFRVVGDTCELSWS